jgi:CheY-like chemotaxis protein
MGMEKKPLIIVADDDKFMRYAMKRHLSQYDFEVQTLDNGFEVLLFCSYRLPDLIISDIRMPKLDGVGLLRGLNNNPATENIPVIFMSAYPSDPVMEQAKELGAAFFLIKPFPLKYIDSVLQKSLPKIMKEREIKYQKKQSEEESNEKVSKEAR